MAAKKPFGYSFRGMEMKLSELFHSLEYDARIVGNENGVNCPIIQAGEYVPLQGWDREIDHIEGGDEHQHIYFVGQSEPAYSVTQRLYNDSSRLQKECQQL